MSFRRRSSAGNSSDTDATQVEPAARPGLPFLKKRFTTSWARKNTDNDDEKVARGPLGLRLLHSSPEPLIDIIFVHGLRGGSIKTWRKGNDPRNFWPQLWLPAEPELHNANIHSFGYDSDWVSTKSSILNVHDFGQSLLEEMRNSPYLRDKRNVCSRSKYTDMDYRAHCLKLIGTNTTDRAFHGWSRDQEGKNFSAS